MRKFKKKSITQFIGIFFIAISILIILFQFKTPQHYSISQAALIPDTPVTHTVFLLIFNPILESKGGVTLTTYKQWADPDTLTTQIVSSFPGVSHDYMHYTIKERQVVDGIFIKPDGFQYTDTSYLDCVEGRGVCHQPDIIDYRQLFTAYNICSKNVDEVWMWGGPYFGYWEYNPVNYCGKTQFVMGFNYERSLAEALHDFGHRMEYVGNNRVGNGNWQQDEANEWNKYSLINGHCGNVHYPPGTSIEYNYNKTGSVTTDCEGYLNYPIEPFIQQTITCLVWNCTQEGYMKWWLGHIPSKSGTTFIANKTIYNNWWKYYAYFEETNGALPSQTPTIPFTNTPTTVQPIPGDANNDGKVDGIDYTIWLSHYRTNISGSRNGDFNNDGKVDGIDFVIWLQHFT